MTRTLVIGDIHGCGLELEELVAAGNPTQIILVGDLFDRAKHSHLVWGLIQAWKGNIWCCEGNHERKMLKFLLNERDSVPKHYLWAIDNLKRNGVKIEDLIGFLESLPTILVAKGDYGHEEQLQFQVFKPEKGEYLDSQDVVITHAGVDINWLLNPDPSFTVYGDVKGIPWWDRYIGENLVLYGHLSERDCKPRLRHKPIDTTLGAVDERYEPKINSIGLDTACAHGGYLTGYVIETGEYYSVKAKKDWASELKAELR